jgi:hypothetical protein
VTEKTQEATNKQGGYLGSGVVEKAAQSVLERQDEKAGVIHNHNTSSAIATIKDNRKHPDVAVAQTVAQMVFAGMTQDTIAKVLKIGLDTLHTHYKHELDTGQASMVTDIAQSLAQRAKAGSDTAAIFLLKTRGAGKFTERNGIELTGKDGGAIEIAQRTEILQTVSGLLNKGITIDGEAEPLD